VRWLDVLEWDVKKYADTLRKMLYDGKTKGDKPAIGPERDLEEDAVDSCCMMARQMETKARATVRWLDAHEWDIDE
jgi:hypothetical protein